MGPYKSLFVPMDSIGTLCVLISQYASLLFLRVFLGFYAFLWIFISACRSLYVLMCSYKLRCVFMCPYVFF